MLITQHLQFSLPYRALFSQSLRPDTATRLIDALAVLLVRLHLVGFYWGDVSLSNTLFRRDAETFAAYLVDAETGDLHDKLTDGQRDYDLEVARVNIIGELMDLQAGEFLEEDVDAVAIGDALAERYGELWRALTESESFTFGDRWRVQARIDRLNDLGFDVGELDITTDVDGTSVRIQPKVVDAGHHSRRLMRLTGLDVQENQARRLLNDLDEFRAATDRQREDESFVAHDWLTEIFEPAVRSVPRELRGKLEPAQIYHELLDHRWFLSEQQGRDVPDAADGEELREEHPALAARRAGDPRRAGRRDPGQRHDPAGHRRPDHRLTGSARALAGHLEQGDACGHAGVERLDGRRDRDRRDRVALLADQPRQALALGADHEHQRVGGVRQVGDRDVAAAVQADDEHARPP